MSTMDTHESDSDLDDFAPGVSTNVLLGYASKEPSDDSVSQLGGDPVSIPHCPKKIFDHCRM